MKRAANRAWRGRPDSHRDPVESLEARRLLSAGVLDVRFGGDGIVRGAFGGAGAEGAFHAGAVLPDGRVVVAGTLGNAFLLARYHPDGSPDASFGGGDGFVTTEFEPASSRLAAAALALLPGGGVLLAGTADSSAPWGDYRRDIALARYTPDGSLDVTFGRGGPEGDGKVLDRPGPEPATSAEARALAVLPGGKFLVGGNVGIAPAVFRYNADGALDRTFGGGDGIAGGVNSFGPVEWHNAEPQNGEAGGLALLPGGKILLTGTMGVYGWADEGPGDWFGSVGTLDRFNADGTPDATFGGGTGRVLVEGRVSGLGPAVPIADGRVLATVQGFSNGGWGDFAVARFNPDGSLDPTFGTFGSGVADTGGIAAVDFFGRNDHGNAIAVDSAGHILVTGSVHPAGGATPEQAIGLARLLPDGRLDASFGGGDGVVAVGFGLGPFAPSFDTAGHAVFLAPDSAAGVAGGAGTGAGAVVAGLIGGAPAVARFVNDPGGPVGTPQQAERATVGGATASRTHPGFTGTGYVDYAHASGDFVEFAVEAPAAGVYPLEIRYAHGGTSPRAMRLSVGGAVVPGGVKFDPTGSWRAWDVRPVRVPLAAGRNAVRLAASGQSGPNVDALAVAPPAAALGRVYQAEAARLSGPAAASTHGGYTGTGYADYRHATGDSVEFTVDTPSGGTYALDFRYANGGLRDRPMDLTVDGQRVPGALAFAPTGLWWMWTTVTRSVVLTAGKHAVRLTAAGQSGPNLDAMTVRPA